MGVCIYFRPDEPIDESVAEAVVAESMAGPDDQPWLYCEPPHFLSWQPEDGLVGSSKLNLLPDAGEAAVLGKLTAERHDLEELLHRLCDWSRRHQITWNLDIEEDAIGSIRDGECDSGLREAISGLAEIAGQLEDIPEFEVGGFDIDGPHAESSDDDSMPNDEEDDPPILRLWTPPE